MKFPCPPSRAGGPNPRAFAISILVLTSFPSSAATTFNGTLDNDFNNSANWSNDLPGVADSEDATVASGTIANMSSDYLMANSSPQVVSVVIDGTLNTGANELQLRSGGLGSGDDLTVNGTLNVGSGGTIDLAGAGADFFINGGATATFAAGSFFQASKATDLRGTLAFEGEVNFASNIGDELQLRNGSLMRFDVAGDQSHTTVTGNGGNQMRFGSTADLEVNFAATPLVGSAYLLFDSFGSFTNFTGSASGSATYHFDVVTVTGLGTGQNFDLVYDDGAGSVTLLVVPEPSTLVLCGMVGLAFVHRRRN